MRYPTDLTTKQWNSIKKFFDVGNYGNRRKWSVRTLINAVLYIQKTGCQWRMLPHDFPPYQTVYSFFYRANKNGIWKEMEKELVQADREKHGRSKDPSYAILDSQTVKNMNVVESKGFDGGKKSVGRSVNL